MSDEAEIGGIPFCISVFKYLLPKEKLKREKYFRIVTLMLTFVIYNYFAALHKPLPLVQLKILEDCNLTGSIIMPMLPAPTAVRQTTFCYGTEIVRNENMMAILLAMFFLVLGISVVFSGIIADYFNPRYFLFIGCLLSGFFSIALGLTEQWKIHSYEFFGIVICFFAICQSMVWPINLACATNWFTGTHRGLFFGIWNISNYTGSLFGILITSIHIENEWGWSFYILGLLTISLGFLVLCFLIIHPLDLKNLDVKKKAPSPPTVSEYEMEVPKWLNPKHSIEFQEALQIPGVITYSACIFFSSITSYFFTYQMPLSYYETEMKHLTTNHIFYSISYASGAIMGGLIVGVLKDVFKRSALICIIFLSISVVAIALDLFMVRAVDRIRDVFLHIILGLFVEAPHILMSTSVSADLGTHCKIRRGTRGLSTVAGIVEGARMIGCSLAPVLSSYVAKEKKVNVLIILLIFQFLGVLCLIRLAIQDYYSRINTLKFAEYWKLFHTNSGL